MATKINSKKSASVPFTNSAHPAFESYEGSKKSAKDGGWKIPQLHAVLSACLRSPKIGEKIADVDRERVERAAALRYAVSLQSGDKYVADTDFAPVREYLAKMAAEETSPEGSRILDLIVSCWNRSTDTENDSTRFAGPDLEGLSEDRIDVIKGKKYGLQSAKRGRGKPKKEDAPEMPAVEAWVPPTPDELDAAVREYLPNHADRILRFYRDSEDSCLHGRARLTVRLALDLLRINDANRCLNWSHAAQLAEKMRRFADLADATAWEDYVSQILIAYENGRLFITDGQHRLVAIVLAFGRPRDVQECIHYYDIREKNRISKTPVPMDKVILSQAYTMPINGEMAEVSEMSVINWLDLIADDPDHDEAYALPSMPPSFKLWPDDTQPYSPGFGVAIGVSPQTLKKADQNNLERSGADHLATDDPEIAREIVEMGIDFPFVESLITNIGRRLRQTDEVDADGKKTKRRGNIGDGGRFAAKPSYPNYYRAFRDLINQGVRAWKESDKLIK